MPTKNEEVLRIRALAPVISWFHRPGDMGYNTLGKPLPYENPYKGMKKQRQMQARAERKARWAAFGLGKKETKNAE